MNRPIYRMGNRDEVKQFWVRWRTDAIRKDVLITPACIEEAHWGGSDHFLVAEVDGMVVGVEPFEKVGRLISTL